jgi:hypothetical protein
MLNLYGAPSYDFNQFLRGVNATLKYLYKQELEFVMCGDINKDNLNENS